MPWLDGWTTEEIVWTTAAFGLLAVVLTIAGKMLGWLPKIVTFFRPPPANEIKPDQGKKLEETLRASKVLAEDTLKACETALETNKQELDAALQENQKLKAQYIELEEKYHVRGVELERLKAPSKPLLNDEQLSVLKYIGKCGEIKNFKAREDSIQEKCGLNRARTAQAFAGLYKMNFIHRVESFGNGVYYALLPAGREYLISIDFL